MNCRGFRNRVAQYADQELSGREMLAMQHHCRNCEGCAAELRREQELKSMLASMKVVEPSYGFEDRLCAAINAEGQPKRESAWRPWRTAAVAAVAGAALVLGLLRSFDRPAPVAKSDFIDFGADQVVQGTQDPFGGGPVITVSSGNP